MKFRFTGKSPAEMPFLDHLEELRWRILWSLLAVILCTAVAFVVVMKLDVIGVLMRPIIPYLDSEKLIYLGVTDPFFITFKLALAMGMVAASPIVFYQIWSFLSPALMPGERRAIVPSLYLGVLLFAGGVALAYFVALPWTIRFMLGFQTASLEPNITAGFYFAFVTKLLLAFGVIFELPVVVLILSALGIVTSGFLRSKRRYAFAGMAVLSAMITPGDAITATVVMMGPLLLLYELSIALARLVERGRARAAAESAAESATEAVPEPS
ncbi:MAG: twin-arginine translocase subunit TatC [Longimicrobiales bacterium]